MCHILSQTRTHAWTHAPADTAKLTRSLTHTHTHTFLTLLPSLTHNTQQEAKVQKKEAGLPSEGDFLLRHFLVVTRERTQGADALEKATLLMLPAIRTDWCVCVSLSLCVCVCMRVRVACVHGSLWWQRGRCDD